MNYRSTNTEDGARLDIKARNFWQRGQTSYFDVRVTHVNSETQKNMSTETIFKNNEQEKKRQYLQRVVEIENGSFTPLVFGTNGGVGDECGKFLSELANKISQKENEKYSETINWIRMRLSFEMESLLY